MAATIVADDSTILRLQKNNVNFTLVSLPIPFMSHYIDLLSLQTPAHLRTGLEHRTQFKFGDIEINIFETFQSSTQVKIQYEGLSISGMIRGRKIVYASDGQSFEFLPGTSLFLPEGDIIYADFPQASLQSPVQCATILISNQTIEKKLAFLNEHYPTKDGPWSLDFTNFHFNNNSAWVRAINELLQIATQDRENITLSDLLLKSLLVRIIGAQRAHKAEQSDLIHNDQLHLMKLYIKNHLMESIKTEDLSKVANCSKSSVYRMFDETCNMSPGEYILQERLVKAKNLLLHPNVNISEVAYLCGFNTVSYFVRQFKAHNSCTPGDFIRKFGMG